MKKAFYVCLYMLCLSVGATLFKSNINVGSLGIELRSIIVGLGLGFLYLGLYMTYRVTKQPKQLELVD